MSVQEICEETVDPERTSNRSTVKSEVVEGRTLQLRKGYIGTGIDAVEYAWTRLLDARDGDSIWLDISDDGGTAWTPCVWRNVQAGEERHTDALRTRRSSQVCMRAVTQLGPAYRTAKWC
jgi:hypothetical protein